MDGDSLVGDLSDPVATTEKDRRLQVAVNVPANIEPHLSPEAAVSLTRTGESFLQEILVGARRLAANDSNDLGFTITPRHIFQAEIVERKRQQTRRDKWSYLRDLGLAGIGAGLGNVLSPYAALGLVVVFGSLFFIADRRV
jgi:hypothetical protein